MADELDTGLDFATFDWAVNSGPGRPARVLQSLVGAKEDGVIGPKTMARIKDTDSVILINALAKNRAEYYRSLKLLIPLVKVGCVATRNFEAALEMREA